MCNMRVDFASFSRNIKCSFYGGERYVQTLALIYGYVTCIPNCSKSYIRNLLLMLAARAKFRKLPCHGEALVKQDASLNPTHRTLSLLIFLRTESIGTECRGKITDEFHA